VISVISIGVLCFGRVFVIFGLDIGENLTHTAFLWKFFR
jgi:hypothetical protein